MESQEAPLVMGAGPKLPPPSFADFLRALRLLTPYPGPVAEMASAAAARATLFFPGVGLLIGGILFGAQRLSLWLPDPLACFSLVLLWTALGFPVVNSAGRVAATVAALLKIACLAGMRDGQAAAVLFAPVLGAWAMVVLAIGARDAASPGRKLNPHIAFAYFGWTSVFAGAVLTGFGDAAGIILFVAMAAVVLALRLLGHRFLGGFTWKTLCIAAQVVEVVSVAAVAFLSFRLF